jgi:protein SCO1/2
MHSQPLKSKLKKIFTNPFFIAFLVGIASLHIVKEMSLQRRTAPPPLVTVGPWSLTSHDDKSFGSSELKGKIYIANFFFTRCPTICPKLMSDMKEVYKRFDKRADQVHFVSFSVDPEFDTPQVLKEYREKSGISAPNWTLLTGSVEQVGQVAVKQMKLHVGEKEKFGEADIADGLYEISHVGEILLFDQNGDLRGKFPTDNASLAQLVRSANFLLEKGA